MRRRHTLLVLTAILLILQLSPQEVSSQPATPGLALPVSTGFVATDGADFTAMRRAGAMAVKVLVDWSAIEPDRGAFRWESVDAAVGAATRARLAVTLVLAYTPRWASIATGVELRQPAIYSRQPPKRIADWGNFVGKVMARYKGRVKDWQVWTTLSLPIWRGTATEYFALVKAARAQAKTVDPSSRIVLATPYGLDLISIRRALLQIPTAFDAISLSPRGLAPEALLRPLSVLNERVLARAPKRLWMEWDPRAADDRTAWSSDMVKVLAIARAFKVERIDWVLDPSAGARVLEVMASQVGTRPFVGYLAPTQALALIFGDASPVAVAWSTGAEVSLPITGSGLTVVSPSGEIRKGGDDGKGSIVLGKEPLLIAGLDATVATSAREMLQSQGFPRPPGSADLSQVGEVSVRLGRANTEQGIYNMPFRTRRNGAVEVVEVGGSEAVRTNAAKEIVFIYFDVDDSFMFYVDSRYGVEVSVEVRGASAPQQLGFNLLYDSMTGYRFTPWQWVESGDGWMTYTFRLPDAAFANTWGWDFAINAGGNRREDLTVRSVTVRKTPRP